MPCDKPQYTQRLGAPKAGILGGSGLHKPQSIPWPRLRHHAAHLRRQAIAQLFEEFGKLRVGVWQIVLDYLPSKLS